MFYGQWVKTNYHIELVELLLASLLIFGVAGGSWPDTKMQLVD